LEPTGVAKSDNTGWLTGMDTGFPHQDAAGWDFRQILQQIN